MPKFPVDAPIRRVIKTFEHLGFHLVREGNHIAMARENPDGTRTPLTMPNHRSGISRDEFLNAYEKFSTGHLSLYRLPKKVKGNREL